MNEQLLERLRPITEEERKILEEQKEIQKDIYTATEEFTIDSRKMLEKGRVIDIRTHTRFISFPKHSHNFIEILYMCDGHTFHKIDGITDVELKAGELLFLNQLSYHEIAEGEKNDIGINFIILPQFFDQVLPLLPRHNELAEFVMQGLNQKGIGNNYLHYQVADVLPVQNLIENMVWNLLHRPENHRQMNQMMMATLFMQLSLHTDKLAKYDTDIYQDVFAPEIIKYIEEEYQCATLEELANQMNVALSTASKIVKKSTGMTFKELLQRKRLMQAANLLEHTKLPVTEIIERVGYDNTSYFHRIFKETYQMSPKEYRSWKIRT